MNLTPATRDRHSLLTPLRFLFCAVLTFAIQAPLASAQTSAITYQGRLISGNSPYSGSADIRVKITSALSGSSTVAGPLVRTNVTVVDGNFTLDDLDFGTSVFTAGQPRWIEIEVRTPSDPTNLAAFTLLSPRQSITATPFAVNAANALTLAGSSVSSFRDASSLNSGTLPTGRLAGTYLSALTLSNPLNQVTGTFSGSGAAITSLNATNLASGTIPDLRLSTNVPRLNATNLFTGGQLTINAPGSTASGIAGFPEVVLAARNTSAGGHSALSIDALTGQDAVLYFGENGSPTWGLRTDSQPNKEFQLRLHNAGANTTMLAISTAGNMGLGTAPSADNKLTVNGAVATTSGGVVFPDGTRQISAATNAPVPVATYPAGTAITVTFNGAPCTLHTPIEIEATVSYSAPPDPVDPVLGNLKSVQFSITRPRTTNTDWLALWNTIINIGGWSGPGGTLVVSRSQTGQGASVNLTLGSLFVSGYTLEPDGLGGLREVLFLAQRSAPSLPAYTGGTLPTGALTQSSGISVSVAGTTVSGAEATGSVRSAPVIINYLGGSRIPSVSLGTNRSPTVTVRAPFGNNPGLRDWVQSNLITGSVNRKAVTLSVGGATVYAGQPTALPSVYRVVQSFDGSLYEEYDIALSNTP